MSLLFSGPSSITPWLEEAAFLAVQGKSYSQGPRLVQVLRRSPLDGNDVLFVHDGKTSVAVVITARHDDNDDDDESEEPSRSALDSFISRGCIVRISHWGVSLLPNYFKVFHAGSMQPRNTMICLEVKSVELLGGKGIGVVGDAVDVNESVDVRRALLSIQHDVQVLRENLRRHWKQVAKVAATTETAPDSAQPTVSETASKPAVATLNQSTIDLWDSVLQQAQIDRDKESFSGVNRHGDNNVNRRVSSLQNNTWEKALERAQRDRKRKSPTRQDELSNDKDKPVVLGNVATLLEAIEMEVNQEENLGDVQKLFQEEVRDTPRSRLDEVLNEAGKYPGKLNHCAKQTPSHNVTATVSASNAEPVLGDVMALLDGRLRLSVDDVLAAANTPQIANPAVFRVHANTSEDGGRRVDTSTRSVSPGNVVLGDVAALFASNSETTIDEVLNKANCHEKSRGVAMNFRRATSVENATASFAERLDGNAAAVSLGDVTALLDGKGTATFEEVVLKANRQKVVAASHSQVGICMRQVNGHVLPVVNNAASSKENPYTVVNSPNMMDYDRKNEVSSDSDEQSEVAGISTMLESQDEEDDDDSSTSDAMENDTSHLQNIDRLSGLAGTSQRLKQLLPGQGKQQAVETSNTQQHTTPDNRLAMHEHGVILATGGAETSPQSRRCTRKVNEIVLNTQQDSETSQSSPQLATQSTLSTKQLGELLEENKASPHLRPCTQELKDIVLGRRPRLSGLTRPDKPGNEASAKINASRLKAARLKGVRKFRLHLLNDGKSDIPLSIKTQAALQLNMGFRLPCLLLPQRHSEGLKKAASDCTNESSPPKHKKQKLEQPSSLLSRLLGQINQGNIFSFHRSDRPGAM